MDHIDIGPIREVMATESPDGVARWLVTRHDDVTAALADARMSNMGGQCRRLGGGAVAGEERTSSPEEMVGRLMRHAMITADPPDHTRMRRLVVREFGAKRIEALRPRVRRIADELLDAMAESDEIDFMSAFAFRLPVRVIGEVLGVPDVAGQLLSSDDQRGMPIPTALAHSAVRGWVEERRRQPADDLCGLLVAAQERGDLSDDELVANLLLLLVAGYLTTTHMFGNGLATLLRHPEQLAELRRDLTLMPAAVGEILRHVGPAAFVGRFALEDIEIGGVTIPAGSHVRVMLHSAKHDPEKVTEADTFDIHRTASEELAFGHGTHFCPGAGLAKLEGEVGFTALLRRFPDIGLVEPVPAIDELDDDIIGLRTLPVRLR